MTDPRREIHSDDFVGLGLVGELITEEARASTALDRDPSMMTHFIGDDCQPDGHRSEAIRPDLDPPDDEIMFPVDSEVVERGLASMDEDAAIEGLVGLIFESRSGDTPHIVTRFVDTGGVIDVRCICKAGIFNLPAGCWAMKGARILFGLPAQGDDIA